MAEFDIREERRLCEGLVQSGLLESESRPVAADLTYANEEICENSTNPSLMHTSVNIGKISDISAR